MTNNQTPIQTQNQARGTAGELKVDLQDRKAKDKYRARNWASYNESLKKRGSITLWIDEGVLQAWRPDAKAPKKRGGQQEYSDGAIECLLLVKHVYHLGCRQTEGFATSFTKYLGIVLPIPDYTTLNRRAKVLKVDLPSRQKGQSMQFWIAPG